MKVEFIIYIGGRKVTMQQKSKQIKRLKSFINMMSNDKSDNRDAIEIESKWVEDIVQSNGCLSLLTIGPPSMMGGLVATKQNPFRLIFSSPYGADVSDSIRTMINRTIATIEQKEDIKMIKTNNPIRKNKILMLMPMNNDTRDTHGAIKRLGKTLSIVAERIDDVLKDDLVMHKITELIDTYKYIIVDLTSFNPSVMWEAGYAHKSLSGPPIYICKKTDEKFPFNVSGYDIICFTGVDDLTEKLEKRFANMIK